DFNNLLAAILGNLDLLRKRLAGVPQLERYIDGATQGAKRGAALTQRLLAFARRQDLKPEPVDLGLLVGGMRS
ncbi:histidine kinase dimerization/phospho-acceptor domain-containing protein, partial [Escherichia coli]|uniref:histidine kinase dimerization/phospho-acceptor domain-containing protein n=1 Tax=Escherichia coli TaxID=562 RepID=UPI00202E8A78